MFSMGVGQRHESGLCEARLRVDLGLHKFARIQDSMGIQGPFDRLMEVPHLLGHSQGPPVLFGKTDPMFTGDRTAPGQHLAEEFVERGITAFFSVGLVEIHH